MYLQLDEGENLFFYRNLPIRWVRVTGVVVAVEEFSGRIIYTIDDSSGQCIEAVRATKLLVKDGTANLPAKDAKDATVEPAKEKLSSRPFDVGDVVDVKGNLSIFRDETQINVEKMVTVKSTSQELLLWEKRAIFRRNVLAKPWHLNRHEVQRCRKEAQALEKEQERKNKRARERTERAVRRHRRNDTPPRHQVDQMKTKASDIANNVRAMIREGAANGKYSALGL